MVSFLLGVRNKKKSFITNIRNQQSWVLARYLNLRICIEKSTQLIEPKKEENFIFSLLLVWILALRNYFFGTKSLLMNKKKEQDT